MSRLRILATGYFNSGNLGDDIMKQAFEDYLSASDFEADVVWHELPDSSPREWRYAVAFVREIWRSDKLLLVGGTHFHDDFGPRSLRILFTFQLLFGLARILRCQASSVAVGLGPLNSVLGKRITSKILNCSEVTIVRDEPSYLVARSLSRTAVILRGVDLAFLTNPHYSAKCPRRILGVSVIPYFGYIRHQPRLDSRFVEVLADRLTSLIRSGSISEVRVVVACTSYPGGDDEISRELMDRLHERHCPCVLVPYKSPKETLVEIGDLDFFICSRYHALLLSQIQLVPALLLPYQEKCLHLAEQVALPLGLRLLPEDALSGDLLEAKLHVLLRSEFVDPEVSQLSNLRHDGLEALDRGLAMIGVQQRGDVR